MNAPPSQKEARVSGLRGGLSKPWHLRRHDPTYKSWAKMRQRCLQPNAAQYPYYGARGITICDRWGDFLNFLADMGPRPKGMTLDRIDRNGPYAPENCRWANHTQQMQNRSNCRYFDWMGERLCLAEICRRTGTPYKRAWKRLKRGWIIDEAAGL